MAISGPRAGTVAGADELGPLPDESDAQPLTAESTFDARRRRLGFVFGPLLMGAILLAPLGSSAA